MADPRQIAALPPSVNPYDWFADAWLFAAVPKMPTVFFILNAVCSRVVLQFSGLTCWSQISLALLGTNLLLSIVTVYFRVNHGRIWLYRTKTSPYGSIFVPNVNILFAIYSGLFSFCASFMRSRFCREPDCLCTSRYLLPNVDAAVIPTSHQIVLFPSHAHFCLVGLKRPSWVRKLIVCLRPCMLSAILVECQGLAW